jgi:hypothetical protein
MALSTGRTVSCIEQYEKSRSFCVVLFVAPKLFRLYKHLDIQKFPEE